jgi:hypothetical protein
MEGIGHPRIGPQAGHRHDAVAQLADAAQIVVADVRRVGAILAVPGLVDHQRTLRVRRRERVGVQFLNAARRHRLGVPVGLGEEELQLLHRRGLRLRNRLSPHQRGQGLVAVTGQQQSSKVLTETPALDVGMEQLVERAGILLQRQRHRGNGGGIVWGTRGHRPPPSVLARFPLGYHIL